MNSKDLSALVVDVLEEVKAQDIVKLDVRDIGDRHDRPA